MGSATKTRRLSATEQGRLFGLPRICFDVARCLTRVGHRAWLCGGTVRDLLSGRVPDDLDMATTAPPEVALRVLPEAWLADDQAGVEFGTLQLQVETSGIELTTLRREGPYERARKPAAVEFVTDPAVDAVRRDFTVNALYIDLERGVLLDPCSGLSDLAARRLNCIGDPRRRFAEDHLRLLRAVRISVEQGLVMDRATWTALCEAAANAATLTGPRVRGELERTFTAPGRARGLMLLCRSGLAGALLPDLPPLASVPQPEAFHPEGDVLRHTALVLANLEAPVDPRLAWAAVFHDVGKKDCLVVAEDRIRFDGHDVVSADKARAWLDDHGAPRVFVTDVVELIRDHIRIVSVMSFRPAKQRRFLSDPKFALHLAFHRADCLACHGILDAYDELRALRAALPPPRPEPLLRGRDLVAAGVAPGPRIGQLLAAVEEAWCSGTVADKASALAFVEKLLGRGSGSSAGPPM